MDLVDGECQPLQLVGLAVKPVTQKKQDALIPSPSASLSLLPKIRGKLVLTLAEQRSLRQRHGSRLQRQRLSSWTIVALDYGKPPPATGQCTSLPQTD